jgi:hypothetical protein
VSCAALSAEADLPLAGTASSADRWLVLEHRRPWGRDAVPESGLPEAVVEALGSVEGKVLLARSPGRTRGPLAVFAARTTEDGGALRRLEISDVGEVASLDPFEAGAPVRGPLLLVCTHRVRDACCGRLGVPVYNALRGHVPDGFLWRSSHQGGHRFAANVVSLPHGIQLGRVAPGRAAEVAAALADGRIPLDVFRGRSHHAPVVQAADAAVRRAHGLDRLTDVRLLEQAGSRVRLLTPGGVAVVDVVDKAGPVLPGSCGASPEPSRSLVATIVSPV